MPKANEVYRHFKGGIYKVICVAKGSKTQAEFVVYESVHTDDKWIRSADDFEAWVKDAQGKVVKRFVRIDDA
jgi:hypothetical protein